MKVVRGRLSETVDLFEKRLLTKFEAHLSPLKKTFSAFFAILDQILILLSEFRKKLENHEAAIEALDEAVYLLRSSFLDRKFYFYHPVSLAEFLSLFSVFQKFGLYMHSLSHIEVDFLLEEIWRLD